MIIFSCEEQSCFSSPILFSPFPGPSKLLTGYHRNPNFGTDLFKTPWDWLCKYNVLVKRKSLFLILCFASEPPRLLAGYFLFFSFDTSLSTKTEGYWETADLVKRIRAVQRGKVCYSHTLSNDSSILSCQQRTLDVDELGSALIGNDSLLCCQQFDDSVPWWSLVYRLSYASADERCCFYATTLVVDMGDNSCTPIVSLWVTVSCEGYRSTLGKWVCYLCPRVYLGGGAVVR